MQIHLSSGVKTLGVKGETSRWSFDSAAIYANVVSYSLGSFWSVSLPKMRKQKK